MWAREVGFAFALKVDCHIQIHILNFIFYFKLLRARVTCECSKNSHFTVRKACSGIGWEKMPPLPPRERLHCARLTELAPRRRAHDLALRVDGYICAVVCFKNLQNFSKKLGSSRSRVRAGACSRTRAIWQNLPAVFRVL